MARTSRVQILQARPEASVRSRIMRLVSFANNPGMARTDHIIDCRGAHLGSRADLRRLLYAQHKLAKRNGWLRLAVVIDRVTTMAAVTMINSQFAGDPLDVQVFYRMDDARRWLGLRID